MSKKFTKLSLNLLTDGILYATLESVLRAGADRPNQYKHSIQFRP